MKLQVTKGRTSKILGLFIRDSSKTDGSGLTGLVFNSVGLVAYYWREGDASATSITLVTATAGTFTSGGFKERDATNMPGWYDFHIPNAALAIGADAVAIHLKGAANMVPLPLEIQLQNMDVYDGVRAGLTALPNAAAGATGGLDCTIAQGGTAQAGAGSTITLAAGASAVDDFYKGAVVQLTGGTGVGQTRVIISYVGATKVATLSRAWATNPDATSVYQVKGLSVPATDANLAVTVGALTSGAIVTGSFGVGAIDSTVFAQTAANRVLTGATIAEHAQAQPPVNPTLVQAVMLPYMAFRNGRTTTATTDSLQNDAGTVICKAAVSDDGTTFTRAKTVTGP